MSDDRPWSVLQGHLLEVLPTLEVGSVAACVTSPPYWKARNFPGEPTLWGEHRGNAHCFHQWAESGIVKGQSGGRNSPNMSRASDQHRARKGLDNYAITSDTSWEGCVCGAWRGHYGWEATPEVYVKHTVQWVREAGRVLVPCGALWLILGDKVDERGAVLIPARVMLALQAEGWIVYDNWWHKPNGFPAPTRRCPRRTHEAIILAFKPGGVPRYYPDAYLEPLATSTLEQLTHPYRGQATKDYASGGAQDPSEGKRSALRTINPVGRPQRSVWTIPTEPSVTEHLAAFPTEIARRCILTSTLPEETVLDPFCGTGRSGQAALALGRRFVGIELAEEYCEIVRWALASPLEVEAVAAGDGKVEQLTLSPLSGPRK